MIDHLFALVERLAPRLLPAAMAFLLAALTSPAVVGIYSIGTLAYTAVQALTESAIRQVLPAALRQKRFLTRYRIWSPLIGSGVLVVTIGTLALTVGDALKPQVLGLAPIAVGPLANAWGIRYVGLLQVHDRWSQLAQAQLVAAVLGAGVAAPITVLTRGVYGVALYVLVSEVANSVLCYLRGRRLSFQQGGEGAPAGVGAEFRYVTAYSGAAWLQGQADRALVGFLSGAAQLGSFSTASALARGLGDPLAAATANLLRVEVDRATDPELRPIAARVITRAVALGLVAAVVTIALTVALVKPLLSSEWTAALAALPVLAATTLPSALNWSGSVLQIRAGNGRSILAIPAAGALFAPVIAVAATQSLVLAAWLVLAREFAVSTTSFAFVRHLAPWRLLGASALAAVLIAVVGSAAVAP